MIFADVLAHHTQGQWRRRNCVGQRRLLYTQGCPGQHTMTISALCTWIRNKDMTGSRKQMSKKGQKPARDMEWEPSYDTVPGSDWALPQPAKKERQPHKDLVKWQHCFRDNCSIHRWEKVDAGYYTQIVGKNGVLSKQDETYCKR